MTTPLTAIRTPELWDDNNGVRGLYPRASKYLQEQRLKLNSGINRYLRRHMEARLLASELLGKCGVFWSQLSTEIEAFQLHLVTTTYGEESGAVGKAKYWTLVLTKLRVIWKDLRKVIVEAERAYGPNNPTEMVGQYLWGTLQ